MMLAENVPVHKESMNQAEIAPKALSKARALKYFNQAGGDGIVQF